jgi:hypothetical protein
MSTITELPRARSLPAERVEVEGDPVRPVCAPTERITAILQES